MLPINLCPDVLSYIAYAIVALVDDLNLKLVQRTWDSRILYLLLNVAAYNRYAP